MQIVYSPEEARQVIGENRLAVILGVEVDSLGNWRHPEDLDKLCQGDLDQARRLIGQELDWLHGLGVRQITPIHLTNNAFGGTAIYLRFLEMVNVFVTGERWTVEDALGNRGALPAGSGLPMMWSMIRAHGGESPGAVCGRCTAAR